MTFDRDPFLFGEGLVHWLKVIGLFAGIIFSVTVILALGIFSSCSRLAAR